MRLFVNMSPRPEKLPDVLITVPGQGCAGRRSKARGDPNGNIDTVELSIVSASPLFACIHGPSQVKMKRLHKIGREG
jgi:hypothetical protein